MGIINPIKHHKDSKNKLLFHCFQLERSPLSETVPSLLARAPFSLWAGVSRGWQMECWGGNPSLEVQREEFRGREIQPSIHNWKFTVDVSTSYQIDGWKWGLISNPRSTLAVSYNIMFSECPLPPRINVWVIDYWSLRTQTTASRSMSEWELLFSFPGF